MIDPPLDEGKPPLAPATEGAPHRVALWPDWEWWRGVNGQLYARRPRTSPPRVVRADTFTALLGRIRAAERKST